MNKILATVMFLCLVACNRGEGVGSSDVSDPDMGSEKLCGSACKLTPDQSDMAVPSCGAVGEPCCSNGDGLSCNDGLVCTDNTTCQVPAPTCSSEGSLCFSDNSLSCCDGLSCVTGGEAQGVCQVTPPTPDCGTLGLKCCDSDGGSGTCSDSTCVDGTCQNPPPPCGANGEVCCDAVTCDDGLVCSDNLCTIPVPPSCGEVDQACCQPDNTCSSGLSCNDEGKCTSDVPECIKPTGNGHAYGWYKHHCGQKVFKNDLGNK